MVNLSDFDISGTHETRCIEDPLMENRGQRMSCVGYAIPLTVWLLKHCIKFCPQLPKADFLLLLLATQEEKPHTPWINTHL